LLSEDEIAYRLGDIAVEQDRYEAAHDYFDSVEAMAEESKFSTNVMGRRAIAYIHEERVEEGDALMAQLRAMNLDDPDVLADISHYAYDKFIHQRENAGDSLMTHLNRSLVSGVRAVAGNANDLEALYYLGLAYEASGELQRAVETLMQGFNINPSIPRLNLSLARVLLKAEQTEPAVYLITRIYSASHSAEGRAQLRALQQQIEDGTLDIEKIDELL
jgi:tetratricopeptide (TPR) repeat protein